MKISFSWLKQYLDIDNDPQEIAAILTDIGLEVEKVEQIETIPGGLAGLKIGKVLSKEKHPDADKLNITTVDVGGGVVQQIVCGAPNVEEGQHVVVALPGTTIFPTHGEPFKIKKAKIRGVESLGMICAEDEVGLGDGHDGIMILSENAEIGLDANKFFKVENDTVFEIGLTPNRADAMSHFGVARDLLVALKFRGLIDKSKELAIPSVDSFSTDLSKKVSITVEDSEACPRYAGVLIDNIKVDSSPEWLQNRLRSIGLSPINNIVDITNFILHDMGQPLHAFDANVVNEKVVVKKEKSGVKFTTLDGVERELSNKDLMICNADRPMCIAGVFGGLDSGVSEATTSIFLESAYFSPISVRKTAKLHGLNTDASFRFERGIDPSITVEALKRAAIMISEIAGGEIRSEITDIYPSKINDFVFDVSMNRISSLCGIEFKESDIVEILELLEIKILNKKEDVISLQVPAYRVDVQREADIAEEVLRIYGFNNVPIPKQFRSSIAHRPKIDLEKIQNMVSDDLVSIGITEAMSNSLTKSTYIEIANADQFKEEFNVNMLNPLSSDLDALRQTLLFNGLEAVRLNQNHGTEDVRIFEFGKTYQKFESGYSEQKYLTVILSGNKYPETWNAQNREISFYYLKGVVDQILTKLGILKNYSASSTKNQLFEDGLAYKIAKKKVVDFGWIRNDIKKHFDLRKEVFYAEINWEVVIELLKMNRVRFKELVKYPAVTRDLSLLLNEDVKFEEIVKIAEKCDSQLLKEVSLFDVYKGKNMEQGKKSYAVRFVLQDVNKTLQDKEIDKVMNKIQSEVIQQLSAELR